MSDLVEQYRLEAKRMMEAAREEHVKRCRERIRNTERVLVDAKKRAAEHEAVVQSFRDRIPQLDEIRQSTLASIARRNARDKSPATRDDYAELVRLDYEERFNRELIAAAEKSALPYVERVETIEAEIAALREAIKHEPPEPEPQESAPIKPSPQLSEAILKREAEQAERDEAARERDREYREEIRRHALEADEKVAARIAQANGDAAPSDNPRQRLDDEGRTPNARQREREASALEAMMGDDDEAETATPQKTGGRAKRR